MKSSRILDIIRRAYDHVEITLWAALFAFMIYFVTFVTPNLPELQARKERIEAQEIAAENATFCERLNFKRGTDTYNQCLLDVGQFRRKVEKRIYDAMAL